MECEIRSMSNSTRISDTLPRRGQVNEVCREWLVHEDEAFAYRLQKQEVDEHYTGNRFRNAQVREDFPKAKVEQQKELEEATSKYNQLKQQEETDSSYAKYISEELKQKEFGRKQIEINDHEIAKRVQRHEVDRKCVHSSSGRILVKPDVNQVGLPLTDSMDYRNNRQKSVALTNGLRKLKLSESIDQTSNNALSSHDTVDECTVIAAGPSYLAAANDVFTEEDLKLEAERRLQEERDAELAKLLQEQEVEIGQESHIDRDRLLAIEAQDKEFAKLLQDKERAKLKRAREKAKQKALLKKQQQSQLPSETFKTIESDRNVAVGEIIANTPASDLRYAEESDICSEDAGPSSISNVAIAIDPTFSYNSNNTPSLTYLDGGTVPPYMPIQGQRRTTSLEKKQKKHKHKDGCKQQ